MRVVAVGDPAHDAEAADVVDVEDIHAEEGEVGEVDPVAAVLVACEIDVADRGLVLVGDLDRKSVV